MEFNPVQMWRSKKNTHVHKRENHLHIQRAGISQKSKPEQIGESLNHKVIPTFADDSNLTCIVTV